MMIQLFRVLVQKVMGDWHVWAPHCKVSSDKDIATSENSSPDNEEREQHVMYSQSSPSLEPV